MGDVRAELGISATSVTPLVDGLEQEALVQRLDHPTDRRATLLQLTERGREIVETSYADFEQTAGDLFRHLSVGDRRTLLRIIDELCGSWPGAASRCPAHPSPTELVNNDRAPPALLRRAADRR